MGPRFGFVLLTSALLASVALASGAPGSLNDSDGTVFESVGEFACSNTDVPDGPYGTPAEYSALLRQIAQIGGPGMVRQEALQAAQKREELIHYAVGAAQLFHTGANPDTNADILSPSQIAMIKAIQNSTHSSTTEEWCALLPVLLIQMVEGNWNSSHPGVHFQDKTYFSAEPDEYKSAYRMLDTFGAIATEPNRAQFYCPEGAAGGCQPPARHPEAFIPAGKPPVAGCIAVYEDSNPMDSYHGSGHVGIVAGVSGNIILSIEGNTVINGAIDIHLTPPMDTPTESFFGTMVTFRNLELLELNRFLQLDGTSLSTLAHGNANDLAALYLSVNTSGNPVNDTNQLALKYRDITQPLIVYDQTGAAHSKTYKGCVMPWPGLNRTSRANCAETLRSHIAGVSDANGDQSVPLPGEEFPGLSTAHPAQ
jgi:hypothetical protein